MSWDRIKSCLCVCALVLFTFGVLASSATATTWYVSPSGSSSNSGTQSSPWDIASALVGESNQIVAGDTIYLMDGEYDYWSSGYNTEINGNLWVQLMGTASQRITVCPAPGAHPRINGGIWVGHKENYGQGDVLYPSNYTDFRDIEFCVNAWVGDVVSQDTGPWPSDIPSPFGGVGLKVGTGNRIINCDVHAASEAFTTEIEDVGSSVYGCFAYGCGWTAPDRGHGHCFYTQNKDPNKIHSMNILSVRYPDGQQTMQAYGTGGTYIDHFWLEDNIAMDGQWLLGGGATFHDAHVNRNVFYGIPVWLGYSLNQVGVNGDLEVTNNLCVDATLNLWWIQSITDSNNTIIGGGGKNIYDPCTYTPHYTAGAADPNTPTIILKTNAYESGRGHLVVFNYQHSQNQNVTVNLSGVIGASTGFKLMNFKDFYGTPIYQGTTDSSSNATIPAPNRFNVYVVLTSDANVNSPPTVSAGSNQTITLPTNSVTLSGTVSDDGKPNPPGSTTCTWSKSSGPGTVTFGNANAASTTATFSTGGSYVLTLTASDSNQSASAQCSVIVNTAPTANAGGNQSLTTWPSPNSLTLSGSISDDGLPSGSTTCTWSKTSGSGTVIFGSVNAASSTATFSTTGTYVVRLTASDTAASAYNEATITVSNGNSAPTVSAGNNQSITWPTNSLTLAGTVSDDGLPNPPAATTCTWSKTSGPGTVTFGSVNAASSTATFSTVGTYVVRLTASDSNLSSYAEATITVSTSGEAPYGGTAWAVPGQIEAENYDVGGQNVAYYDTVAGNSGGAYRNDDVDIRTTTDANGGYLIKDIYPTEYLKYTINVASTGSYIINIRAAGTNTGKYLHFEIDGNNVTGSVTLPATADWDNGTTTAAPACNITAGQHILRMYFDTGDFNVNWIRIDANGTSGNNPPTVSAGNNQTIVLPAAATLSGTVSDDGLPNPPAATTCTWSKNSGPGTVTFGNQNAASTTATFSVSGTYVLTLTASDSNKTASSNVTITADGAPTANAGSNQTINLPAAATLSGSISDDGIPAACTCTWSKTSGPGTVTFGNQNAASTSATFSVSGTYVLTLTANDTVATGTSTVTIKANAAPTANAGNNQTIVLPAAATLSGSISDDGIPAACTCTWSKTSGPGTVTFGNQNAASTTATFSVAGTYVLTLTANDTAATGTSNVTITADGAPTAYAGGNQAITLPTNSLTLAGTISDDGIPAACTCTWSKTSGPGTVTFGSVNAASSTATFSAIGTYVVRLTVTDTAATAYNEATIIVNTAPTANAGVDQSITLPTNSVTLSGSISDDGIPAAATCTWSKTSGPGTVTFGSVNAANTTATFSTTGTYVVRLTATDTLASVYDEATIIVNGAPTANAGVDQEITWPTNSVTLAGTISDDGIPAAATCTWSKTSGPGTVTFGNVNAASTTATFSTTGTYVVRLTVTDTLASTYDEATITVDPNSGTTKTAWLKLDEGSGSTASDSSGNGHTGTLYSSPSWITGKFSNALSFNGSSSYLGISNFSLNSSFSISFWFKPASGSLDSGQGGYHYAFSWGNIPESTNGINVWFTTGSEPNWGTSIRTFASDANGTNMNDSDCLTVMNTSYNFYDGNWHLYTLTFSGTNGRKVYLDGNMKVSDTKDVGHSITLPTGIYVGARSDLNSQRFYNGGVDDLRIYNLELASTDVTSIYNGN